MALASSPVWLITGCSTGIGREIALAALAAGDRVAVTARERSKVADIVEKYPGQAIALTLDVTNPAQVTRAVADTEAAFGSVDVLVNNAGYGYLAAIEEGEEEEVRAIFETNYFGAVAMIKAVLPGMRARSSGCIINISSMTGLVGNPGVAYYASTKWAMEGMTEALSKEVAPFGIRVSAVEPGGFRTDWSGRSMKQTKNEVEAYADTVGVRRKFIRDMDGKQTGDPKKAAQAIVDLTRLEKPPLRLLLGSDVYNAFRAKLADLDRDLTEWAPVTLAMNFEEG